MAQDIVDRVTGKQVTRNSKRKLSGIEKFWLIFRYIALVLIWFLVVMPIYVMIVNSFKGVNLCCEPCSLWFSLH